MDKPLIIFGTPRSGTTLLYQIISPYQDIPNLQEAFNPTDGSRLIDTGDTIRFKFNGEGFKNIPFQLREDRIELVLRYPNARFFMKIFPKDLSVPDIFNYVKENYTVISIDRRDKLDTVLSAVIAHEYNFFNSHGGATIKYEHKISPEWNIFSFCRTTIFEYYRLIKLLPISHTVYYEDIIEKSCSEILNMVDIENTDTRPLPLRKLLSKEEKMKLIKNLPQLLGWYETYLEPYLP